MPGACGKLWCPVPGWQRVARAQATWPMSVTSMSSSTRITLGTSQPACEEKSTSATASTSRASLQPSAVRRARSTETTIQQVAAS